MNSNWKRKKSKKYLPIKSFMQNKNVSTHT